MSNYYRRPLTDVQVRDIKRRLINGDSPRGISMAYGLNTETVRRIGRGETHRNVRVPGDEALYGEIEYLEPAEADARGHHVRLPPERPGLAEESLAALKAMGAEVPQELPEGSAEAKAKHQAEEFLGRPVTVKVHNPKE